MQIRYTYITWQSYGRNKRRPVYTNVEAHDVVKTSQGYICLHLVPPDAEIKKVEIQRLPGLPWIERTSMGDKPSYKPANWSLLDLIRV